jgi:hypothetical protein
MLSADIEREGESRDRNGACDGEAGNLKSAHGTHGKRREARRQALRYYRGNALGGGREVEIQQQNRARLAFYTGLRRRDVDGPRRAEKRFSEGADQWEAAGAA